MQFLPSMDAEFLWPRGGTTTGGMSRSTIFWIETICVFLVDESVHFAYYGKPALR